MSVLKHLKTLQHVSIIIQIIFRELVGSLLESLNLKVFVSLFFNLKESMCSGENGSTERGIGNKTVPEKVATTRTERGQK
jgi:hypothetical protein